MESLLLAIDIGNTQTVAGLFDGEGLEQHWRLATESHATGDQLAAVYQSLLALAGRQLRDIDQMIISSVVPSLTGCYQQLAQRYLGTRALIVGPGIKTGLPILINNPHEVGADRIVNAVAALAELGGPCIIVDFGTATTFCAVSAGGEYLGGAIAPGLEISLEALASRAARLAMIDLCEPESVIGKTTAASLCSGMVLGFAGLVDGIVERMKRELGGGPIPTIATGGHAALVVPHTRSLDRVDPLLTLKGLKLVNVRNQA
jgi:type III pantothenate kinase